MELPKKTIVKENISVENINILYFDLKRAKDLANVSNQTLYTYASDATNNICMVKFKGKNYLHKDDIDYIKKEVEASKSIRNVAAVTIKSNNIESKELEEIKNQLDIEKEDNIKLKDKIKELEEILSEYNKNIEKINMELNNERQDKLNFMSEILELKEELGRLREFETNTDNLNEIIKTLNREKDQLYKNQINALVEANTEIMSKFDKLIDSQNAFQVMLAQKEQTSQKLIEDRNQRFLTKLFKKK